jgi:hypothetical protein
MGLLGLLQSECPRSFSPNSEISESEKSENLEYLLSITSSFHVRALSFIPDKSVSGVGD